MTNGIRNQFHGVFEWRVAKTSFDVEKMTKQFLFRKNASEEAALPCVYVRYT